MLASGDIGLQGVLQQMKDGGIKIGEAFSSIEAVQGALALTKEGAYDFFSTYLRGD